MQVFCITGLGIQNKSRAHKLHERGLAGFVGAIEDGQLVADAVEPQVAPRAETVNLQGFDVHPEPSPDGLDDGRAA